MKKKITLSYILSQFALLFLAVLVIYPLFFVLMTSVKSNFDVLTSPFAIHSFKPQNYIEAWKIGKIGKYFMNSVFITAVTLLVQMVVIVLASYSFGNAQLGAQYIIDRLYDRAFCNIRDDNGSQFYDNEGAWADRKPFIAAVSLCNKWNCLGNLYYDKLY